MPDRLDDELAAVLGHSAAIAGAPLRCGTCGDTYPEHEAGGGHCRAKIGGGAGPASAYPCVCPGFRWVDPGGPPVGSYSSPPTVGAGRYGPPA